jgi:hypothetical protein
MFGLFGKSKAPEATVIANVASTRREAHEALAQVLQKTETAFVFYYFEESKRYLIHVLEKNAIAFVEGAGTSKGVHLCDAKHIHLSVLPGQVEFFGIDFYPFYTEFFDLKHQLAQLSPKCKLNMYAGLDEPIFRKFGSDRIQKLMKMMGMKEGELVTHSMIAESIQKAQQKVEERVVTAISATSAEEWFSKNLPDTN